MLILVQVREVAIEAIARARRGDGPTLIEAETYRFRGHSLADPDELRSPGTLLSTRWLLTLVARVALLFPASCCELCPVMLECSVYPEAVFSHFFELRHAPQGPYASVSGVLALVRAASCVAPSHVHPEAVFSHLVRASPCLTSLLSVSVDLLTRGPMWCAEEKAKYAARDPIVALKKYLLETNMATEVELKVCNTAWKPGNSPETAWQQPGNSLVNSELRPQKHCCAAECQWDRHDFTGSRRLVAFSLCWQLVSPAGLSSWYLLLVSAAGPSCSPVSWDCFLGQAIEKKVDEVVEDAVEFADESPLPVRKQLLENVFVDPKGFGIGPDGKYRCEDPAFTEGTAAV